MQPPDPLRAPASHGGPRPSGPARPPVRRGTRRVVAALAAALLATGLAACGGGGSSADLVVYSGAEPNVLEPLVAEFEQANDVDVEVRTGDSPSLALLIGTEGDKSRADVFVSQSAGSMGYLVSEDRLRTLPDSILSRVPERLRPSDQWVPISGRVRTLVYNTNEVDPSELPASVFDLTDAAYEGKVGLAPNNGSFIDFVSALRTLVGDDETQAFLDGLQDNGARTYPNNLAVVAAVARGEIDYGLVNHYYNEQATAEDPEQPTANHLFPDADPGALVLTSAVAVLDTGADHETLAHEFIEFLLTDASQEYLTNTTREYAVVDGVDSAVTDLPPLAEIRAPEVDLASLGAAFEESRQMIADSGLASS